MLLLYCCRRGILQLDITILYSELGVAADKRYVRVVDIYIESNAAFLAIVDTYL